MGNGFEKISLAKFLDFMFYNTMIKQLSFKASFIKNTVINKTSVTSQPEPFTVALVELNPKNKSDLNLTQILSSKWKGQSFIKQIYQNMLNLHFGREESNKKYLAITKIQDSFKILKPENVLGICEIRNLSKNNVYLNLIQTNPEHMYKGLETVKREFKNIGKVLIESIIDCYPQKYLTLNATQSSFEFYKKIGFKLVNESTKYFVKYAKV